MTFLLARLSVLRLALCLPGVPSGGLIPEGRLTIGAMAQRGGRAEGFSEASFG